MRKYKNVSGQSVGFLLDGKTYDFQNNEIISAPDNLVDRIHGIVTKIVPMEESKPIVNVPVTVPIEAPVEQPKKKTIKKVTK
jgi:hypothetical protein